MARSAERLGFRVRLITAPGVTAVVAGIEDADAALIALERPAESVLAILDHIRASGRAPTILLRASAACARPELLHPCLDMVDCVIGTGPELARLAAGEAAGPERVVTRLLALGARAVCHTGVRSCVIRTAAATIERPRPVLAVSEEAAATDRLSAALAFRAVTSAATPTSADLEWALAASAVSDVPGDSMHPMHERIDGIAELLRARPTRIRPVHRIIRHADPLEVSVAQVGGSGPDRGYAVVFGDPGDGCLVRIHSRCFYGESLGIDGCDCAGQLRAALDLIQREGAGILIYLEQEGRGAGLLRKAVAHRLSQLTGRDTFESYELLGLPADARSYAHAVGFLRERGLTDVRLLTNNPLKVRALRDGGLAVTVVRLVVDVPEDARAYLRAKQRRGHWITADPPDGSG